MSKSENPVVSQVAPSRVEFNLHGTNSNTTSASTSQARTYNYVKLRPQNFTGTDDDFEDFLRLFEITSEINGWNYRSKSLYLANSLTGAATALLNELNADQRRGYQSCPKTDGKVRVREQSRDVSILT